MTKQQAPYMRAKDFDHEDVDLDFKADGTIAMIANMFVSIGVFCALMVAILIVAQVPDSWLSWLVMYIEGV